MGLLEQHVPWLQHWAVRMQQPWVRRGRQSLSGGSHCLRRIKEYPCGVGSWVKGFVLYCFEFSPSRLYRTFACAFRCPHSLALSTTLICSRLLLHSFAHAFRCAHLLVPSVALICLRLQLRSFARAFRCAHLLAPAVALICLLLPLRSFARAFRCAHLLTPSVAFF